MQTEGRRAFARGLVLLPLPFLFSCAASEVEPAASEVEPDVEGALSELGTHAREVVLFDDFECGALASPPWSGEGDVEVREDAARRGAFGVQLAAGAALTAEVDTRGRAQLKLAFSALAAELEGHEALRVEVAVGDHPFRFIAEVSACDWSRQSVRLPRYADDRERVRVRFSLAEPDAWRSHRHGRKHRHGWRHRHDDARVLLDDVVITGVRSDCDLDAGEPDAQVPDAAAPDAGPLDAGTLDAGAPDAAIADAGAPDASAPDAGTCTTDAACSDGNVCNGEETCAAGRCVAGVALRCDDGQACTADRCDPTAGCVSGPGLGLPCEQDGVCDATGACVACVPPANTYDAIQLRIFDSPRYVCTSCHRTGGRLIDLTAANSYAVLLGQTGGRPDVVPGIPETSILYDRLRAKVEGTVPLLGGNPMPRGNAPAITRAELDAIAAWISAGAPRTGVVAGTEGALCVPPPPPLE